MKRRKLKPFVVPMLYTMAIALFVGSMYFIDQVISKDVLKTDENNTNYVSEEIIENNDYIPVVEETEQFMKPYRGENVEIAKNYYDYKAESKEQEKSIIYYENTYMQNTGVDYSNKDTFEVISSINGTVTNVEENELTGKSITIENANNIKIVYQSLSDITVSKDQTVTAGQIIAKSGTSNINSDLGNHLHFELYINNESVNPENYYDKYVDEMLQG